MPPLNFSKPVHSTTLPLRSTVKLESLSYLPAYMTKHTCKAKDVSNVLNKWLKREFAGKTAHCPLPLAYERTCRCHCVAGEVVMKK